MAVVGTLSMNLVANSAGFTSGINSAARTLNAFQGQVQGLAGSVGGQLAGLFGAASGAGFLGWGVKLAADAEAAQSAFAVLTGSGERAARMLAEIKTFSQQSPLSQATLRDAATTMMSFGVAGDSIIPTLWQIGDLSMGNGERFASMALAFGQVTAAGRLMGQEVLQFINSGFNPLQEIARKTGESMRDLKARMEAGGISAQEVADALKSATSEGGKFHGMLDARAGTTAGHFAKMQASAAALAQSLGESLLPAANRLMDVITPVVQSLAAMDDRTRANIVTAGALAVGIGIGVVALSTLVRAVQTVVTAYRAMTTAQVIAQAFAGPKGWAALAGSALIAAGAVAGVAYLFDNVAESASNASASADKAAASVAKVGQQGPAIAKTSEAAGWLAKAFDSAKFTPETGIDRMAGSLDELMKRGQQVAEQFRTPEQAFAATSRELGQLFAVGAINAQTYRLAMADARKQVADAAQDMERMRGVGAATVGSREGFSAVQEALRNMDAQRARERAVARAEDAAGGANGGPAKIDDAAIKIAEAAWQFDRAGERLIESLEDNRKVAELPAFKVANF